MFLDSYDRGHRYVIQYHDSLNWVQMQCHDFRHYGLLRFDNIRSEIQTPYEDHTESFRVAGDVYMGSYGGLSVHVDLNMGL